MVSCPCAAPAASSCPAAAASPSSRSRAISPSSASRSSTSSAFTDASLLRASNHSVPGAAFLNAFSSFTTSPSRDATCCFCACSDALASSWAALAPDARSRTDCPAFFRPGVSPSRIRISISTGFILSGYFGRCRRLPPPRPLRSARKTCCRLRTSRQHNAGHR